MFYPCRFEGKAVRYNENNIPCAANRKLLIIKTAHTAIWCVLVAAILYVLYAGMFNNVNTLTWICIGSVFIEGIVLFIYKGKCPFTVAGHKYAENPRVGFDIFLPEWLAKYNKLIFTSIFIIGLILVVWRVYFA
jgi:hypothetical protein